MRALIRTTAIEKLLPQFKAHNFIARLYTYFWFSLKYSEILFNNIKQIMPTPGAPGPSTLPHASGKKRAGTSGLTTAEKKKLSDARKATLTKRIVVLHLKAVDGTTLA